MNHIELTEYNLTIYKTNRIYSIVWSISKINDLKTNVVVLGGDIVNERTSKKNMNELFNEFKKINLTHDTYYIFGNHDTQPDSIDSENRNKTFRDEELNNVVTCQTHNI